MVTVKGVVQWRDNLQDLSFLLSLLIDCQEGKIESEIKNNTHPTNNLMNKIYLTVTSHIENMFHH